MDTITSKIALKIIEEQELIIGPLAWNEARKVPGLRVVDQKSKQIDFDNGNPAQVIDNLVNQYDRLFGRASREVSRKAAMPFLKNLNPTEVPLSLK